MKYFFGFALVLVVLATFGSCMEENSDEAFDAAGAALESMMGQLMSGEESNENSGERKREAEPFGDSNSIEFEAEPISEEEEEAAAELEEPLDAAPEEKREADGLEGFLAQSPYEEDANGVWHPTLAEAQEIEVTEV